MSEMSVIEEERWKKNEKSVPVELCVVDVSNNKPVQISVPKDEWYKESKNFYFDTGTNELKVQYRWDINGTKSYIFIYMHSDEKKPKSALESIVRGLGLSADLIIYSNDSFLGAPKYQTMRVDDNANEIEITSFHRQSSAEFYAKHMEAKGHKQLYFVKESNT
ncbi:hypothetical protein A9Q99_14505 [Gammaproteobacteria bacterium 45_16_T64]|nr:hypothetical protein A9Q99_14505 [Gammaproteobacteria bacterium 45_16_T64]